MYSSPLGATSEMRAARLTVRPKMSPSRATIGPSATPTWPGGVRERQEVGFERGRRRPVLVVADQEIADHLARSADLAFAASPTIIREGQVEQLECALKCAPHPAVVAGGLGTSCASDFAADVTELLHEGQLHPSAGRQVRVKGLDHVSAPRVDQRRRRSAPAWMDPRPIGCGFPMRVEG